MNNQARHTRCPWCSGNMRFVIGLQKLKCDSCDSTVSVEEYEKIIESKAEKGVADRFTAGAAENDSRSREFAGAYTCLSCGGQLSPGVLSVTDTCPFCGNDIVFTDKFRKHRMPDFIIPFKKERKDFLETYRKRLQQQIMIPEGFKKAAIDSINAVYYPFWIYDLELKGFLWARTEEVVTVQHRLYNYFSSGVMAFSGIPQDASRKLDDRISQSLEPYSMSEAKPFSFAYLSGMKASVHDVDQKAAVNTVIQRVYDSMDRFLCLPWDKPNCCYVVDKRNYKIETSKISCAMFPILSMDIKWKNRTYNFSMNGESGKFTEHFPYSITKLISCVLTTWFLTIGTAILVCSLSLVHPAHNAVFIPFTSPETMAVGLPAVFFGVFYFISAVTKSVTASCVCAFAVPWLMWLHANNGIPVFIVAVLGFLLTFFSGKVLFTSRLTSILACGLFSAGGLYFWHLALLIRNTDNSVTPHTVDTYIFSAVLVGCICAVISGIHLKKATEFQNPPELKDEGYDYYDMSKSKRHFHKSELTARRRLQDNEPGFILKSHV